jgi:2,3-bisphosphoglycerate-dependent phosphoglycerate mutase
VASGAPVVAAERPPLRALQGKNKAQTRIEFGEEQFMLRGDPMTCRRRSPMTTLCHRPAVRQIARRADPKSECLKDVVERLLPYWYDAIVPDPAAGSTVLVSACGNSLVKHLGGISDHDIAALNLPTGVPLV